ncbi:hypothetical protein NOJ17_31730 [Neorhizobium galegae]|nr:hypothetical protein [Neorhizobium galegae]UIY31390.1 hypothetical protein LZK73_30245 [Neorhizobium galegae]
MYLYLKSANETANIGAKSITNLITIVEFDSSTVIDLSFEYTPEIFTRNTNIIIKDNIDARENAVIFCPDPIITRDIDAQDEQIIAADRSTNGAGIELNRDKV